MTQRLRSTYRRLTTALEQEGRGTGQLGRTGQVGALDASRLLPPQTSATGRIAATYIRRPVRLTPLLPLAGEAAQPPMVRALLERAAADLEHGCYDAAVDDCQQAIAEAPDYLPAHLRLAEAYAGQGLLSEAAAKCRFLLQVYEARQETAPTMPVLRLLGAVEQNDLEAWTRMAELYFTHGGQPGLRPTIHALVERADRQGQSELALEYAERLIEHSRDDDEARRLAAALQLRGGNPNRALTYYQTLLRRDHNDMVATAGANIALTIREGALHWPSLERLVSLLRQGGPANDVDDGADDARRRCLALYRQVIPTAERAVDDLYVAAGLAHLAVGDGHAALGYLDAGQGAEVHFDANGRFVLAYALTQANRGAGGDATAERHWLEHASELLRDPGVSQFAARTALFGAPLSAGTLHADLAESMLRSGQVDEALAMLQRLTAEHPDDAAIRQAVAAAYHRQGKLGQALDELDKLANQQLNAGKLVEMAETLRKMSEFAGDNLAVKSRLADLFLKRGFPDEALREFDRIAAIHQSRGRNQEAAETLRRAADVAWMIGRRQDAFALYDRVLELAPDNVMLRQAYINCLLQGGQQSAAADQQRAIARTFIEQRRLQESIAALHQVIVLDPRDAEAYNRLGEALASVGEYAQAERVYRRLVRLTPDDPLAKARQTAMAMLVREQGAGAS